jgi:hypothetical protein
MKFDQSTAICHVFTYKEGLLSTLGHDLRIAVTSFIVEVTDDARAVKARFDAGSLHVECAMVDGAERPKILTSSDKREIDRNIVKQVLETGTFKDIFFDSSSVTKEDSSYNVKAALTLHGRTREISLAVRKEDNYYVADFRLHLPDFGIKPFSALFGTLKIKPDILVRVMIPDSLDEKGFSL